MKTLLAEDLLLLTAHPTRGTLRRPTGLALPRALAGAALSDLLLLRALRLEGDRLVGAAAVGAHRQPLVEHALARLGPGGLSLDEGIEALAAPRARLGQHLLRSLAASGAIERRDRRLLGLLPVSLREVTAGDAVQALRARVGAALAGSVEDPRATALAGMVNAGDLHRAVHLRTSAPRRRQVHLLVSANPVAAAVARTIHRARRDAATTGAVAATAGAIAASGS